jgi:hypothetical protein
VGRHIPNISETEEQRKQVVFLDHITYKKLNAATLPSVGLKEEMDYGSLLGDMEFKIRLLSNSSFQLDLG